VFLAFKRRMHEYFRTKRLKAFAEMYPNLQELSVLDVGGSEIIWNLLKKKFGLAPKRLVLLNNNEVHLENDCDYEVVTADARAIPFPDKSFDLVFSNSVIEHVGDELDKAKYASECQRVGKEIYIQTPNRWFPVEPHILAVFIHWLPRPLYKKLHFVSIMHLYQVYLKLVKGSPGSVNTAYWVETADLLSLEQVRQLFPSKKVTSERVLGYSKSFIIR
jgi:ubiquinone/menaquinone biosynthesis C-methylase UbiE